MIDGDGMTAMSKCKREIKRSRLRWEIDVIETGDVKLQLR